MTKRIAYCGNGELSILNRTPLAALRDRDLTRSKVERVIRPCGKKGGDPELVDASRWARETAATANVYSRGSSVAR